MTYFIIDVYPIQELMKTTRPGCGLHAVLLKQFNTPDLCVVRTLFHYILRTKDVRKSSYLFISIVNFRKVTTCSLSRWLKTVFYLAGVDVNNFKAHSFRGALRQLLCCPIVPLKTF